MKGASKVVALTSPRVELFNNPGFISQMSISQSMSTIWAKEPEYYRCARLEMLPFVPTGVQSVLEVGSGAGIFGRCLKETRSAEYWGVEVSPEIAEESRQFLDRVICGNIEKVESDLPSAYFDAIVFNDVLEHLADPWEILSRVRRCLSARGCVVASIPNVRYWQNLKSLLVHREWEYTESGILDRTHLRFFTEKSLAKFFSDCGYELVRKEGINGLPLPRKVKVVSRLLGGCFDDTRHLQFACVALPKTRSEQKAA